MLKTGRANYFSVHRALPSRTLGCLWEGIANTTWGVCSWDSVAELVLQGTPELPGVWSVERKVHLQLCKHQLSLYLFLHWLQMESKETISNCPDHKLPSHPRCQGRSAMILPAVFRCSPAFCINFLARLLLPGTCIHCSSLTYGPRYVLSEATGSTASDAVWAQQHPDHSPSRHCRAMENQRNDDTAT